VPTDPLVAFGSRIRDLRVARGWSQERLAEVADLHRNYVGGIERGERNCALRTVHALAEALGVTPADLFPQE
jgi:transcriptional regulator with XRE-family HTH domain